MKKYIIMAIGALAIVVGGIDWLVGALVPHSRFLMIAGAVAVAAAGFMHRWEKLQKPQWPLLMTLAIAVFGAADACAMTVEQALTPPDKWLMAQWNPNAMPGREAWIIVLVFVIFGLAWLVIQKFLSGSFQSPQKGR